MKNPNPREVCGVGSYTLCGIYKTPVQYFPQKCGQKSQNCFVDFQSGNFFWLAKTDVYFIGKKKKYRKVPIVTIKNHDNIKIRVMKNDDYE